MNDTASDDPRSFMRAEIEEIPEAAARFLRESRAEIRAALSA